jgi:hypothetical protein
MRRRSIASGVLAVLAGALTLVSGCAVPAKGQASYEPPRAVGSLSNTGADAKSPSTTPSVRPSTRPSVPPTRSTAVGHPPDPSLARPTRATTAKPTPGTSRPPAASKHKPAPRRTQPPAPPGGDAHQQTPRSGPPNSSLPEFAVCLSFYQLSREPTAEFQRLPTHASLAARTKVAQSFSKAHAGMVRALQHSGLPRRDVVYARGSDVAQVVLTIAKTLPTGRGVSNRPLRTAYRSLTMACAR